MECAERAINKVNRTFAAQTEALNRYRSKGNLLVRIVLVNVGVGGQAIAGNVHAGKRDNDENSQPPHATRQCCTKVQCEIKAKRPAVHVPCRARLARLPYAWRARWSATGARAKPTGTMGADARQ